MWTYKRIVNMFHPSPLSVWRKDLQRRDGLTPQNGDASEICARSIIARGAPDQISRVTRPYVPSAIHSALVFRLLPIVGN